jgi:hypothetical protein
VKSSSASDTAAASAAAATSAADSTVAVRTAGVKRPREEQSADTNSSSDSTASKRSNVAESSAVPTDAATAAVKAADGSEDSALGSLLGAYTADRLVCLHILLGIERRASSPLLSSYVYRSTASGCMPCSSACTAAARSPSVSLVSAKSNC